MSWGWEGGGVVFGGNCFGLSLDNHQRAGSGGLHPASCYHIDNLTLLVGDCDRLPSRLYGWVGLKRRTSRLAQAKIGLAFQAAASVKLHP
ncbi:MAG: hypothetical protein AAGE59_20835 [Cyanobacteria bacterium P01_F01_bin.86]